MNPEGKKASKPTKTAATASKQNGKGGKKSVARTPSPTGGESEPLTPPDTARPNRAGSKRKYEDTNGADSEGDEDAKKVKVEVDEDEGEA